MKKLVPILMILLCLSACSDDETAVSGGGVAPKDTVDVVESSPITVSATDLEFEFVDDSTVVYVESEKWWIDCVTVDDTVAWLNDAEKEAIAAGIGYSGTFRWLTVRCEGNSMKIGVGYNLELDRTFSIRLVNESDTVTVNGKQNLMLTGGGPDIGLSTTEVTLNGDGETVTVGTEARGWWVVSIVVDGETCYFMQTDDMSKLATTGEFMAECGWLTMRCENWQIILTAEPNEGKERTFTVKVQWGDWFGTINGRQSGRE